MKLVNGPLVWADWCGLVVAFSSCRNGQECMSEHSQGGLAMPGNPAAELVLVNTN